MSNQINKLTEIDSLVAGDNFEVFDLSNGNSRKCSLSAMQTYMQSNLTFDSAEAKTQYESPLTGADIQVESAVGSVYLRIAPVGTLANLEISLPVSPVDKQEVLVKCTQIITALVVSSAKTIYGAPTDMTAHGSFRMRYDAGGSTWDLVA